MQGRLVLAVTVVIVGGCGRRGFDPDACTSTDVPVDTTSCSVPPAGCQTPEMYTCNGTCFVVCGNVVSRPAAAVMCTEWGGCLATIKSDAANNCAAQKLTGRLAWIGATQQGNPTAPSEGWFWCDGSPLSYLAWATSEPSDSDTVENGEEQCATLDGAAVWRDDACDMGREVVCSRPM